MKIITNQNADPQLFWFDIVGKNMNYGPLVVSTDNAVHYTQQFLNSLCPSGLPTHILKLKIRCLIMLYVIFKHLINLNLTKLKITVMRENIIKNIMINSLL